MTPEDFYIDIFPLSPDADPVAYPVFQLHTDLPST